MNHFQCDAALWDIKLSGFSSLTPFVMCDNITISFAQSSKHLLEGKEGKVQIFQDSSQELVDKQICYFTAQLNHFLYLFLCCKIFAFQSLREIMYGTFRELVLIWLSETICYPKECNSISLMESIIKIRSDLIHIDLICFLLFIYSCPTPAGNWPKQI